MPYKISFLMMVFASFLNIYVAQSTAESKEEGMKVIVRKYFEEFWNKPDFDSKLANELIAPNYVLQGMNGKYVGLVGCEDHFNMCHQVFPDLYFTVDDQIAEGDVVVTRWSAKGTHRGKYLMVEPTGRHVEFVGITLSRLTEGKILEEWVYWDSYGLLHQLGKAPIGNQEMFSWGPPSEVKGSPGDPDSNKSLVLRYIEVWNRHSPEDLEMILSSEFISHDRGVWKGIEGQKWLIEQYSQAFPDFLGAVLRCVAERDSVVTHWIACGTHKGELFGLKPTWKKVEFGGITISRIADGKIVEMWWALDFTGLLQQAGAFGTER